MFRLYASIGTNLLFFEKGTPTKDIWFREHQVPKGPKVYSMTKSDRLEHLADRAAGWGGPTRAGRVENDWAWKVSADDVKARGFNLDIKNPHSVAADLVDPALLHALDSAEADVARIRDQLKSILAEPLTR